MQIYLKNFTNRNSHSASSTIVLMQGAKLNFFITHFLISPILYEGSTSINFGFFIKEDFWYVVSILNFTGLNACITFIRKQNFNSIY